MSVAVEAIRAVDFAALGVAWRDLEARAPAASFFQSWDWVGCCVGERFPDPVLLRAEAGGACVGLALFNRRGARLLLTETGEADRDSPFVEWNAPLVAADAPPGTEAAIWRAAWRAAGWRRLVLGGVAPEVAAAAGGVVFREERRPAPHVDLAALRVAGTAWRARLSSNTRYQIGRAERLYAARGELAFEQAGREEASAWFAALAGLHTASWERRGQRGAYATPFQQRFHAALVERTAGGALDLWRASAGGETFGYLCNFRRGGRVSAYQSGFVEPADPREKPGLVAHSWAIERAQATGAGVYDFLAGAQRYKASLATGEAELRWSERSRCVSIFEVAATGNLRLKRLLTRR
jgi:CelD/BcsL family acetyltransferase involved in cellulose biosynthesis